MAKASEKYELMYILRPDLSEEETAAVVEKFKALVEANGTLEELEEKTGLVARVTALERELADLRGQLERLQGAGGSDNGI